LNEFSFDASASYDLLVDGPALKPPKPNTIPDLNFNDLPQYVTTSEEDDDDTSDIVDQKQAQKKQAKKDDQSVPNSNQASNNFTSKENNQSNEVTDEEAYQDAKKFIEDYYAKQVDYPTSQDIEEQQKKIIAKCQSRADLMARE